MRWHDISDLLRACALALALAGTASAANFPEIQVPSQRLADPDEREAPAVEPTVTPPAFPKEENLGEFTLTQKTPNRFFLDRLALSVGADGEIRYTLVVKAAGGATNVTYEGLRCYTAEYRIYAIGRADGSWATARTDEWRRIENKPINRHHAELRRNFFCPAGMRIDSAAEGLRALQLGKHPNAP